MKTYRVFWVYTLSVPDDTDEWEVRGLIREAHDKGKCKEHFSYDFAKEEEPSGWLETIKAQLGIPINKQKQRR